MVDMMVNYVAVIAGTVISMVVGFLWYGPLFGKQWMRMMGMKKEDIKPEEGNKAMLMMVLPALITAYVMAVFVKSLAATDAVSGAMVGFWAWLGFVATVGASSVLFEKKPTNMYLLNQGHYLVVFAILGALFAIWV